MHSRVQQALQQLPSSLQPVLSAILADNAFAGVLTAAQVHELQTAGKMEQQSLIFHLLPIAAAYAWVPISHFYVGAIAKGISGNLYFGANMEFRAVAIQQTIHAEQCAITNAWMQGESKLLSVSINYSPCGHCRQFMNELNSNQELMICLPEQQPQKLHYYLPQAFGPVDLQISTALMDRQQHTLPIFNESNPLKQAAIAAATISYAPYSHAYSGIALQTTQGEIIKGSYAENAAFNPSLPPLQAALIMLNLRGLTVQDIQQAVLVELADVPLSQFTHTQTMLTVLGCHQLHHILL